MPHVSIKLSHPIQRYCYFITLSASVAATKWRKLKSNVTILSILKLNLLILSAAKLQNWILMFVFRHLVTNRVSEVLRCWNLKLIEINNIAIMFKSWSLLVTRFRTSINFS